MNNSKQIVLFLGLLIQIPSASFGTPQGPLWQPDPWSSNLEERITATAVKSSAHPSAAVQLFDPQTVTATERNIREKFDNREVACAVTFKPNGFISSLSIAKSSGSALIDKMALDLVKASEPILSSEPCLGNLSYLVELPAIRVTPLTAAHADWRIRTEEPKCDVRFAAWFSDCQHRFSNALYLNQDPRLENKDVSSTTCTFQVEKNGQITNVTISKTSGSSQIDANAERIVRTASPLSPPPLELTSSKNIHLELYHYPLPKLDVAD